MLDRLRWVAGDVCSVHRGDTFEQLGCDASCGSPCSQLTDVTQGVAVDRRPELGHMRALFALRVDLDTEGERSDRILKQCRHLDVTEVLLADSLPTRGRRW